MYKNYYRDLLFTKMKASSYEDYTKRILMVKNLYEILGVPKGAGPELIEEAFKKKSEKYQQIEKPTKQDEYKFRLRVEARDYLLDPKNREFYNDFLEQSPGQKRDQMKKAFKRTEEQRNLVNPVKPHERTEVKQKADVDKPVRRFR